jgi:ATP:ADP antiporter, AAA family
MALYENLNLRREETMPVLLLVLQSVFLGFFLGAFDVGANTLFLNSFGQSMIPRAIIISGLTGIVLTSLYSYFQSRLRFSTLAVINLFTVFALTFALRAGYYFSDTKWLAFALFVLMGPLNIIALVGFWGTVGRIFDLRQGKRIFGFIDTGQVVGVIVSSLSIPFLVTLGVETKNLLHISAISIFLALIFQFAIGTKYPNQLNTQFLRDTKKSAFSDTLRIPYVRTMSLFVILSMLVAFFVHYLFLSVADERFNSPEELAKFFGGLMGTLTIVSVLIKTFVYGPLMKTYGLKISLLVSPVIMIILTVSAALVGSVFGYTMESASFTFFFLLISLSKFFQKSLKDSIEGPVLKIIYQSLPVSIRHEVQARVDGTINETAALAAGVILAILGFFSFINLIHYSFFLIGFIIIWFIVAVKLFQGYQKMLRQTLEAASLTETKIKYHDEWIEGLKNLSLKDQLKITDLSKPWLLPELITRNIPIVKAEDARDLYDYIKQKPFQDAVSILEIRLENQEGGEEEILLKETLNYLKDLSSSAENEQAINDHLNSKDFEDRLLAAKYIGFSNNPKIKQKLTFLFRDMVSKVKKQAIWSARGTESKEIISFLIDFLEKDEYAPLAHAALAKSGSMGIELLQMAYGKIGASDNFRKRVIRIMPDTGSPAAKTALLGNLSVQSNLKTDILEGLIKLDFTSNEREGLFINQLLIEQAGVCAWNLNVLYQCPAESKAPQLRKELEIEFNTSRHNLFQLLKLQYDKSSIDVVIENLEAGTGESISFALELLDTFIADEIKPYISPLLENTTLSNKIWGLQNYFPLRVYSQEDLLKAIINRNENLIGKQAKIYALSAFNNFENIGISEDLAAQLFNSDKILRQISAQLIRTIDQNQYVNFRRRLNDKLRVELDRSLEMSVSSERNSMERLTFFKGLSQSKTHAAPLFWLYNSSFLKLSNQNLLDIGLFKGKEHIIVIETGNLKLMHYNELIGKYEPGEIFVTEGIDPQKYTLVASEGAIIHYIDHHKFLSEIYNYDYLTAFLQ